MKFVRILGWFVLGAFLAFAAARSLTGLSWGSGDSDGRGAMTQSAYGAEAYLPQPPYEDEASSLAFGVGVTLGYSAGEDYVGNPLDFEQSLEANGIDPRLKPIQMSDSASDVVDWMRVGVIEGLYGSLNREGSHEDPGDAYVSRPVDENVAETLTALHREVLNHAIAASEEFHNPITRAQLLLALESRGGDADEIRPRVIAAVNESIEAGWWNEIWSSSIWAPIGGLLLAFFGVFVEKTGARAFTAVAGKSAADDD